MIFKNHNMVGLELDKAFNAHNDKTRGGLRGTCMSCAHDITKNHRRRNSNLQKRIPGNHARDAIGHKSSVSSCCFCIFGPNKFMIAAAR